MLLLQIRRPLACLAFVFFVPKTSKDRQTDPWGLRAPLWRNSRQRVPKRLKSSHAKAFMLEGFFVVAPFLL